MTMLAGESAPLATVSVASGTLSREKWSAAGAAAADELFKYSHVRSHADPGTLVYLQFDNLDFTEELRTAAIAGFDARWKQLVQGWEPPIRTEIQGEASS